MRSLVLFTVAAVAGLAVGAALTARAYTTRLDAARTELAAARQAEATLRREARDLQAVATATQDQLRALEDRMARLDARAQTAAPAKPQHWPEPPVDASANLPGPAEAAPEAAPAPQDDAPGQDETAEREAREARRAEFRQRFQERVDTFFEEQYARARTAEEQERIALMQEYSQYAMDLRGAMRDAETDEEREALAEQFRDTWTALRGLRDEQRAAMLREVAADFGLTGADQQAFTDAMLQLQESPFFNTRAAMGGGGGRGPR
jgi:hypothetical protein